MTNHATTTFRIFFDMDGVLVDFDRYMREWNLTGDEVKKLEGAYSRMHPIEHALWGIRKVMSLAGQYGGEVWLATKPPTGIPWAYADKVSWVLEHLPELRRRIIITHDKGLLGSSGDILVDDRPHRANCMNFPGALVHFGPTGTVPHWHSLVDVLHRMIRHPAGVKVAAAAETEEPYGADEIDAARSLMGLGPLTVRNETRLVEEFVAPSTRPPLAFPDVPIATSSTTVITGLTLNPDRVAQPLPVIRIGDKPTTTIGDEMQEQFIRASEGPRARVDHGDTTHGPGWVPHDQPKA